MSFFFQLSTCGSRCFFNSFNTGQCCQNHDAYHGLQNNERFPDLGKSPRWALLRISVLYHVKCHKRRALSIVRRFSILSKALAGRVHLSDQTQWKVSTHVRHEIVPHQRRLSDWWWSRSFLFRVSSERSIVVSYFIGFSLFFDSCFQSHGLLQHHFFAQPHTFFRLHDTLFGRSFHHQFLFELYLAIWKRRSQCTTCVRCVDRRANVVGPVALVDSVYAR